MLLFDGLLFGSGLTQNLLHQLRGYIPAKKQYLLSIDEFLKAFFSNSLNPREQRLVFSLFYSCDNAENRKNFNKLKAIIAKYYQAHDANIEYHLGVDLFQKERCNYPFNDVATNFPFFYNIWHDILFEYLLHLNLGEYINGFTRSVGIYLGEERRIFTTNFDAFAEELNPEHIHGYFVKPYHSWDELVFQCIDDSQFLYKCIWGWNGIGKLNILKKYRQYNGYERYFNLDFFFDSNFHIDNLLVYGLGFQKAGYMNALSSSITKYKNTSIGGIIDEHILIRLSGLQNLQQLGNIHFAYYSKEDLANYQELVEYFSLSNVDYVKATEFRFSIEH